MLQFDEENARRVEAVYMTPDVVAQREATRAALALRPGERVVDIGSGPGFLVEEMAGEVGPGGHVAGVDPSESMLALGRGRDVPGNVEYHVADAFSLPFGDGSFDVAISTQVLEYVDDVPRALAEARRVLRAGGRLLVLDTDWDSIVWHSGDGDRMRRVLEAWDEHLAHPYLPRKLPRLLADAGFELAAASIVPVFNRGYDPNTYSGGLIDIVAGFVAGRQGIEPDEAAAWARDLTGLGDDYFFSLNRYLFLGAAV